MDCTYYVINHLCTRFNLPSQYPDKVGNIIYPARQIIKHELREVLPIGYADSGCDQILCFLFLFFKAQLGPKYVKKGMG